MNEEMSLAVKLRGDIKFELFDAMTGAKQLETEEHNVVTNYTYWLLRNSIHGLIGGQYGGNSMFNEQNSNNEHSLNVMSSKDLGFLKNLYLTDNSIAVSASTVKTLGTVTGFATREPYVGTDVLRGSVNINECLLKLGSAKLVFDFGSDRANGTHKSVFLTDREYTETNVAPNIVDAGYTSQINRAYTVFVESDDGYFYGALGSTLYKIDHTTLAELETYTLPTSYSNGIFDVAGGFCYFTSDRKSGTLYKYSLSTETHTTFSIPVSSSNSGAVIGGYLYYNYSNTRVYRVDVATGSSTSQSISAAYSAAIYRLGSTLYLVTDKLYAYDWDANTLTPALFMPTASYPIYNTHSLIGQMYCGVYISSYYNGSNLISKNILRKAEINKDMSNACTAKVLTTPVVKSAGQTMKVTYTIGITTT